MGDINPTERGFLSYIDKSRNYYLSRGHNNPYRWASNSDAPFAPLTKPLEESRIGLFTTASLTENWKERRVYAAPSLPPPESLYTRHLAWHKGATHTDDVETFLPITCLNKYAEEKRIANISRNFYGVPTDYSTAKTTNKFNPEALSHCHNDGVDAALLVAL